MKVIKDVGTHRVIYREKLVRDEANGYDLIIAFVVQVHFKFLFWNIWADVKTFETNTTNKEDIRYLKLEAIDLFNTIVYPDKYFITNGQGTC